MAIQPHDSREPMPPDPKAGSEPISPEPIGRDPISDVSLADAHSQVGPTQAPEATEGSAAHTPASARKPIPSTRVGAMWVALCATAVVFVALIVFLLQNTRRTQVSFLWMEGSAPLAITLLIAAVGAALITALLGTVRIAQLRRVARQRPADRGRR
jgi:lipopolysaccharide assembly protein A